MCFKTQHAFIWMSLLIFLLGCRKKKIESEKGGREHLTNALNQCLSFFEWVIKWACYHCSPLLLTPSSPTLSSCPHSCHIIPDKPCIHDLHLASPSWFSALSTVLAYLLSLFYISLGPPSLLPHFFSLIMFYIFLLIFLLLFL